MHRLPGQDETAVDAEWARAVWAGFVSAAESVAMVSADSLEILTAEFPAV